MLFLATFFVFSSLWSAKDKVTVVYVKLWSSALTKNQVFPSNREVARIMARVCEQSFKVTKEYCGT